MLGIDLAGRNCLVSIPESQMQPLAQEHRPSRTKQQDGKLTLSSRYDTRFLMVPVALALPRLAFCLPPEPPRRAGGGKLEKFV
jgi:hypothetical protein